MDVSYKEAYSAGKAARKQRGPLNYDDNLDKEIAYEELLIVYSVSALSPEGYTLSDTDIIRAFIEGWNGCVQ